tara:strand:- start:126 stop:1274 length:1149 start_codon:yes stop_codon:yes gene_type:complete
MISFFNLDLKFVYYFYLLISLFFLLKFNIKIINLKKIESKKYIFFFSVITISIFFYIAHNLKLEWDGHHWLEKVVFFYNENKIENFYKLKIHPEYPHLGSYIWALFWKNSFINHEYVGRLFFIYFYIVSIFSLTNFLDKELEKFKILIILFLIIITFEPYLFGGYQDYLLFSILVIASRLIFILDFKKINFQLLSLIILSLGLLMWFKDEGLFYFLIFSPLLIINIKSNINYKLMYFLVIFSILLFNYLIQKYLMGVYELPSGTAEESFIEIKKIIFNFELFFVKSYKILLHMMIASIKYLSWILIAFSVLLFFYKKKLNDKIIFLTQCLIFNLLFLYTSFMTFRAIDYMLTVALDRLLFQTSGFYLILFILVLNKMKLNYK